MIVLICCFEMEKQMYKKRIYLIYDDILQGWKNIFDWFDL